jgi:general secretion pathway protein D
MKTDFSLFKRTLALLLILTGVATSQLVAQQRGGGGGGGGGFGGGGFGGGGFGGGGGGGGNNRGGNSSSGNYNLNGTVGSALISVDPQTHNLVVITDAQTSLQISNVIANLDVPKPQVLIKVVFMEVQRNNSSDVGVEGSFAKNNIGNGMGTSAGSVFGLAGVNGVATNLNGLGQPLGTALTPSSSGSGTGGIYQIAGSDFQATLRAIATSGKAQVLSRPSIIARDGQLARIVVGQQVPLPSGVSYATSGANTIPIINVSYNDVGIILNVTPFIGANGLVEMIVQPQISSVSPTERQSLSADVSAPYVNVRSADTVVVTPDAQTVVIGGLISNNQSTTDKKVPILGDIPLLGNLFKSKAKSDAKTELLIFLTPHIIKAPSQMASLTGPETHQAGLITNSVSEKELDRFLERVPAKK